MVEQGNEDKTMTQEEREARLERLKQILNERGDDVAKLIKTWLHKEE